MGYVSLLPSKPPHSQSMHGAPSSHSPTKSCLTPFGGYTKGTPWAWREKNFRATPVNDKHITRGSLLLESAGPDLHRWPPEGKSGATTTTTLIVNTFMSCVTRTYARCPTATTTLWVGSSHPHFAEKETEPQRRHWFARITEPPAFQVPTYPQWRASNASLRELTGCQEAQRATEGPEQGWPG